MIEFGPNVYGIQAAAQYYFQKDASLLSPEESIFLAMLKVAPHRGPKWIKRGKSPTFTWWKSRTVQIFDRLVKEGLVTERRAKGAAPFVLKWSDGEYLGAEASSKWHRRENDSESDPHITTGRGRYPVSYPIASKPWERSMPLICSSVFFILIEERHTF